MVRLFACKQHFSIEHLEGTRDHVVQASHFQEKKTSNYLIHPRSYDYLAVEPVSISSHIEQKKYYKVKIF